MGAECGTHGGVKFVMFWWGNMKESDHLQYQDINEKIEIKELLS
jgi:hypothetical protein